MVAPDTVFLSHDTEIARVMDTTARTVRRWETRETDPPSYLLDALRQRLLLPQEQRVPGCHRRTLRRRGRSPTRPLGRASIPRPPSHPRPPQRSSRRAARAVEVSERPFLEQQLCL